MAFRGLKVTYLRNFRNFEIDSFADIRSIFRVVSTLMPNYTTSHQMDLPIWGTCSELNLCIFCTSSSKE